MYHEVDESPKGGVSVKSYIRPRDQISFIEKTKNIEKRTSAEFASLSHRVALCTI